MSINNQILEINQKVWNYLNFWKIKKNNFQELIKKIIITNLESKKLNFNFPENEKYFQELSLFIKKNIFNKKKLEKKDYEKLYTLIFTPFENKKNLYFRDKIKYNMVWLDDNWKKIDFYPDYTKIQKLLNIYINKYNNENLDLFERLYSISLEILNKVHPFANNNFAYTSIILDILLIKNNLLPINIKKTFKVNNLFYPNLNIFKQVILKRYQKYTY